MALLKYNILRSREASFDDALADLIHRMDGRAPIVRVVFFGTPLSDEHVAANRFKIAEALFYKFGDRSPVFSYVAQPPFGSTLVVETHTANNLKDLSFRFSTQEVRYAVIESARGKAIFTGGIIHNDFGATIAEQSRMVLGSLAAILGGEGLSVSDISRQWNYIPRITHIGRDGQQHYQAFNDARSDFYSSVEWNDGYPAATGIGTTFGGVMVEVDAAQLSHTRIVPLDNSLQVAAHHYSTQVLCGSKILSTPKFERAKAIDYGRDGVKIYISGTAAIRGEESLKGVGIEEQTRATVENIDWLVGHENMAKAGIEVHGEPQYKVLRVYLKYRSDYMPARTALERRFGSLPILYVLSDVCREELLIELEGVVEYNAY